MKSHFDKRRRGARIGFRGAGSRILLAIAALAIPAAAMADPPPWAPAHGRRAEEAERYDDGGHPDHHPHYYKPRPIRADEHIWRGDDGHYHCRRSDGTTGLVVGAAVGALVGNQLASGDRTLGTVLGAAGGGLLGRAVDRGNVSCR
jgi:hypothetical protein